MAIVSSEAYAKEGQLAKRLNDAKTGPGDLETEVVPHPEGVKRGGYLATYTEDGATVFYDELDCTWLAYDDGPN